MKVLPKGLLSLAAQTTFNLNNSSLTLFIDRHSEDNTRLYSSYVIIPCEYSSF